MKLFKKFLLAAGLVGLVGSLGFATQAQAAESTPEVDLTISVDDSQNKNEVTWSWAPSDPEEGVDGYLTGKYDVYIGNSMTPILKDQKIPANFAASTVDKEDLVEGDIQEIKISLDDYLKNAQGTQQGAVSIVLRNASVDDESVEGDGVGNEITPWFYVSIKSEDRDIGTVRVTPSINDTVVKKGTKFSVEVTVDDSNYQFSKWTGIGDKTEMSSKKANQQDIPVVEPISIKATFEKTGGGITSNAILRYTIYDENNVVTDSGIVTDSPQSTKAVVGYRYVFTAENGTPYTSTGTKLSDGKFTGAGTIYAYAKGNAGYNDSPQLKIDISSSTVKVTTSDFVEYITDGYTLEFKAKAENGSQNIAFAAASDFKDYVDGTPEISKNSDSDKTVTVKVKFKEKLDKGNTSKEIKLTATVDGKTAKIDSDTDTDTTKKVTIYSRPTASISTSDRKLTYKVPSKVNTGNTDGKESDGDEKDNTLTKISEVKGVKLRVYNGDTSLGFTQTAKSSGTSSSIDAGTMESLVINLSSKFSGESATAKFRVYPNDSDGKYNKNVYADSSVTVYRAVITWTDEAGKTGSVNVYGFEGQTIDAATVEKVDQTLKGKNLRLTDADGKTITSFKMGTSASVNDHKAVLGAREPAADDTGLDRVPRTGQNNALVYVMVAIVACAVCGGLYVYNKKSKNI